MKQSTCRQRRHMPVNKRLLWAASLLPISLLSGCALLQQQEPINTVAEQMSTLLQLQDQEQERELERAAQLTSIDSRLDTFNSQLDEINRQLVLLRETPVKVIAAPPPPAPPSQKMRPIRKPDNMQKHLQDMQGKTLIGKSEWLWVQTLMANVTARVDTGTETSFIHATGLNLYEKDGEAWARFTVTHNDSRPAANSAAMTIDTPVVRMSRIRGSESGESALRPVIKLPVRLGNIQQVTEFILSEQSNSKHSVSLGRNFLKDLAVVDVSVQFLQPKFEPVAAPDSQKAIDNSAEAVAQ